MSAREFLSSLPPLPPSSPIQGPAGLNATTKAQELSEASVRRYHTEMASAVSSIAVTCCKPQLDGIAVKPQTVNPWMQCVRLSALSRNSASKNHVEERKYLCSGGRKGSDLVVAMATGESADPGIDVNDLLKSIQEVWEEVDDKYAIVGLGFAALIALWGSTGLIGAIDKLPFVPSLLELVGIGFSGWFVYRNLLFKPDREELLVKIQNNLGEIIGNK